MKNLKTLLAELDYVLYNDGSESDVELVLESVQNEKDLKGKFSRKQIRKELKKVI